MKINVYVWNLFLNNLQQMYGENTVENYSYQRHLGSFKGTHKGWMNHMENEGEKAATSLTNFVLW